MGAEQSKYEGPPEVLEERDIPSLVKYMKSPECKNVFVMMGAGASTSAGIPDFRSPGTGLYSNLARLNLPYPEAVFDISFFRQNPLPFYTLAKELLPGRFRPTLTHSFVRLLYEHKLLRTCFTQNIDTLERRAGLPGSVIVEAHGSFAGQHCIDCKSEFDDDLMRDALLKGEVAHCEVCNGLIKPDIVFFGESLPSLFHTSIPKLRSADLLIVIGTSLTVQPFASLASMVPESCPRVLINLDLVGDFGSRPDDVICLGKCDDVVREIARELGWEAELNALWAETENSVVDFEAKEGLPTRPQEEPEEEKLEEEIEVITSKMKKLLGEKAEREGTGSPFQVSTGEEVPVIEDRTVLEGFSSANAPTAASASEVEVRADSAGAFPGAIGSTQPRAEKDSIAGPEPKAVVEAVVEKLTKL